MATNPDDFVHDSQFTTEIDPRNDSAIFAAKQIPNDDVSVPNKMKGSPLTESSLYLLGAGRPYGQGSN